jgi:hypothetical protein
MNTFDLSIIVFSCHFCYLFDYNIGRGLNLQIRGEKVVAVGGYRPKPLTATA